MRVVTLLILLPSILSVVEGIRRVVQCSPRLFCNEKALDDWRRMRGQAVKLIEMRDKLFAAERTRNSSHWKKLRADLCMDNSFTAFLLLNETMDETRLSCIWPGSEDRVVCTPVPEKYTTDPYHFIDRTVFIEMIRNFRKKMGCYNSPPDQERRLASDDFLTSQVHELHVCNERCTQAGISYLASCFMLIAFSLALVQNCFTPRD